MAVIAAAVAITVVAGVWYLRPQETAPSAATPSQILGGPYSATYDFLTPSLGWALIVDYSAFSTRFFVFKTADGAGHWQKLYVGKAEGGQTYLHFFDQRHGFLYAGLSYRTVDGGTHWQLVDLPGNLPYVTFASPTAGWAEVFEAGNRALYRTRDGGQTWTRLETTPPAASVLQPIFGTRSMTFRDSGEGWLGAFRQPAPVVFMTADGGASWHTIQLFSGYGSQDYDTTVVGIPGGAVAAFVSESGGMVLGAFLSLDHGHSWQGISLPASAVNPDDITFVDSGHWWWFDSRGAISTTDDAGRSWLYVAASGLPGDWTFAGAEVVDQDHAWWALTSSANSELGALAITSDGGRHWRLAGVPQP